MAFTTKTTVHNKNKTILKHGNKQQKHVQGKQILIYW